MNPTLSREARLSVGFYQNVELVECVEDTGQQFTGYKPVLL